MTSPVTLEMAQGEDKTFYLTDIRQAGSLYDFTGASATFEASFFPGDTVRISRASGGSGITFPAAGQLTLVVSASSTSSLVFSIPVPLVFEIRVTKSGVTSVLLRGTLWLNPQV